MPTPRLKDAASRMAVLSLMRPVVAESRRYTETRSCALRHTYNTPRMVRGQCGLVGGGVVPVRTGGRVRYAHNLQVVVRRVGVDMGVEEGAGAGARAGAGVEVGVEVGVEAGAWTRAGAG